MDGRAGIMRLKFTRRTVVFICHKNYLFFFGCQTEVFPCLFEVGSHALGPGRCKRIEKWEEREGVLKNRVQAATNRGGARDAANNRPHAEDEPVEATTLPRPHWREARTHRETRARVS